MPCKFTTPNTVKLGFVSQFIDIYEPIAGWKAIHWVNENGFWEPEETSPVAFATAKEAYAWAQDWAESEDILCMQHPELEGKQS